MYLSFPAIPLCVARGFRALKTPKQSDLLNSKLRILAQTFCFNMSFRVQYLLGEVNQV